MLDTLREELLADVLRRLPAADLQSARLACRAADAAARSHLDAFTSLCLTPFNTVGGDPDWARWPRLAKIRIYDAWVRTHDVSPEAQARLRRAFAALPLARAFAPPPGAAGDGARAALGRVTTLDMHYLIHGNLEASTLAALLGALPGLAGLALSEINETTALLSTVAALAPQLGALDIGEATITLAAAEAVSGMRQLRALRACEVELGDDEKWPDALLPREWLTSLSVTRMPLGALPWLALRELRGVSLRCDDECDDVAPLAAGLPQLTLLTAHRTGHWDPIPPAGFKSVTHAQFDDAWYGSRLSVLLPSVETLVLLNNTYENAGEERPYDLQGLTALTSLETDLFHNCSCVSAGTIDAVCTPPSLKHMSLVLKEDDLPRLAQLPTTLLELGLCLKYDFCDPPVHCDQLLLAVPPLSRLTTLHLRVAASDRPLDNLGLASQATLPRFVRTLPALRKLELCAPALAVQEVALLCAHPALRMLAVQLSGERDRAAFGRLAADHAARGLALCEVDRKAAAACKARETDWIHFKV